MGVLYFIWIPYTFQQMSCKVTAAKMRKKKKNWEGITDTLSSLAWKQYILLLLLIYWPELVTWHQSDCGGHRLEDSSWLTGDHWRSSFHSSFDPCTSVKGVAWLHSSSKVWKCFVHLKKEQVLLPGSGMLVLESKPNFEWAGIGKVKGHFRGKQCKCYIGDKKGREETWNWHHPADHTLVGV